ncbi:hypothetical protein [Streptomyces griseocarneus]|uniref:hypothetical protein n=1 Tax=Streptomyces griseocarneus TaxID=51201 RepID=UPI00167C8330|nr:hypothetical protein [Streptomyces griseocarneus]MBZ6477934.1 hypothetical protein [Streptomyces griseocarneus]GHG54173.1 hypothetical protein GCM10018779_16890 [Streptomyces griseocarneus]
MSTDIYGCIEVRNPCADEDWYEWAPWHHAMDLYPLYSDQNYAAFACLFGVRNSAGWDPLAAGRGLPADVSPEMKEEFDKARGIDPAVHSPTWVTWAELDRLDMDAAPAGGRDVRDAVGPGTGWEHVFAVMRALAGRFGGDGVRLVAYFD